MLLYLPKFNTILAAGIKLCCSIVIACDENRGRCILDACCPVGECVS